MSETDKERRVDGASVQELEELCKVHSISLELIRRSHDLDGLMDVVLDELEQRLEQIPGSALGSTETAGLEERDLARIKALMAFTSQAAELKSKAKYTRDLQDALAEAEAGRERIGAVIESISAGVVILDRDGRIIGANQAVTGLVGHDLDRLRGEPLPDWIDKVPPKEDGEIQMRLPGEGLRVRLISRREVAGSHGGEVILIHDITERDRMLHERHYKEKMHGMMQTIGMLTHQINNPLTALLGRAQILKMKAGDNEDILKAAGIIEESARRIAGLIQDLSELAKSGDREELEELIDRGLEPGQLGRREP